MTPNRTLLTIELLAELASFHQMPCLSLYQPTHRRRPENQQDLIRFRNLVKELETSLRQKYPAVETRLLLEPFKALARDHKRKTLREPKSIPTGTSEAIGICLPKNTIGHCLQNRHCNNWWTSTFSAAGTVVTTINRYEQF